MEKIISIRNLSKSYGDVKAVKDLSFDVYRGQLFAFLGVNGAGKSTTISIICGQLKKDGGQVVIDGHTLDGRADEIKRSIGVVFQNSVLDKSLSVYDNLESRAACYGIVGKEFKDRLEELSRLLDFEDLLKRSVGKLSGGQRRRIDIARALLHEPKILILDEPTTGLDPQTRRRLQSVIDSLRRDRGMTVFLTTHYMEEAADADYVVILDSGAIVAQGTPLDLKNKYTGDFINIYNADEEKIKPLGLPYRKVAQCYRIEVKNTAAATELIRRHAELFTDYEVIKGNMDDVFLNVTGRNLSEGGEL